MNDLVGFNIDRACEWNEFADIDRECAIDVTPLEILINQRGVDRSKSVVCVDCGTSRYGIKKGCGVCGSPMVAFRVRKEDREILHNPSQSMNRVWFHATDNPDWLEDVIKADATVHLGSFSTALNAAAERSERDEAYVWEIHLKEGATIAPWVCPDSINQWTEEVEEFNANLGFDFVNYVNLYESPGSISLIGDPNKLVIVGMDTIEPLQAVKALI